MKLSFSIEFDHATPAVDQLLKLPEQRQAILSAMGHGLVRDISRHVINWGLTHPNKLGGRRTNYWSDIGARITPNECLQVDVDFVAVTLDGARLPGIMRAVGPITILPGTKTPGVKYLAIPAGPESYGLKPREIPGLVLFWAGRKSPAGLATAVPVQRTRNTKKGKKGTTYLKPNLVMYWFAKSATVPQDRTLLPSDDDLSKSANQAAENAINVQLLKLTQ